MSGIIRIHKKTGNYSIIDNTASQDDGLSLEALGFMAYLLPKPDNWQIRNTDLMKRFTIGRDKCSRILKELETAGYLLRTSSRNSVTGHFEWESHLFENPELVNMVEVQISRPRPEPPKVKVQTQTGTQEIEILDDRDSPHYDQEKEPEPDQHRQKMIEWVRANNLPPPDTEAEWGYLNHEIVRAYLKTANNWPGWSNIKIMATEYRDSNIKGASVENAAKQWSLSGYKIGNILGIMEWAANIEEDSSWTQKRKVLKSGNNKSGPGRTSKTIHQPEPAQADRDWWQNRGN
jgi:hypothetical protein